MKRNELINLIHTKTIENQGFSVNLAGEIPVSGYMVSLSDERKFDILRFNKQDIERFINDNFREIDLTNELYFIGSWIDNDIVYLDVSINPENKELALFWGIEFNQLAVYDVVNQKTIYLDEENN